MSTLSQPSSLPFANLVAIDIRQTDRLHPKNGIGVNTSKTVIRGEWKPTIELTTATQVIELTVQQAGALGSALLAAAGYNYGPIQ